jgi:hypothetical protein
LYGSTDLAGNTRDSLPTESEDISYPFSPVLANPSSIENLFADFGSDFLPPGTPHYTKKNHTFLGSETRFPE